MEQDGEVAGREHGPDAGMQAYLGLTGSPELIHETLAAVRQADAAGQDLETKVEDRHPPEGVTHEDVEVVHLGVARQDDVGLGVRAEGEGAAGPELLAVKELPPPEHRERGGAEPRRAPVPR